MQTLAKKHPNVEILKVDIDKCNEISDRYNTKKLPSFVLLKSKNEVKSEFFTQQILKLNFNTNPFLFQITRLAGVNSDTLLESMMRQNE